MGTLLTHPAADLFPMLADDELSALAEDIKANGLRQPVVTFQGKLLDGRNRLRACNIAGVQPRLVEWAGGDPIAYVVSLNLKRRHLDESQRGMAGARAKTMYEAEAKERQRAAGGDRKSLSADLREPIQEKSKEKSKAAHKAAALVNVGARTVESASKVLRDGAPRLVAAVDAGRIAVSAAAEVARLPVEKQQRVLDAIPEKYKGSVRAVIRQVEKREVAEQIRAEPTPMPAGPYRVIVSDPPWAYDKRPEDPTHRANCPYPPMTTEEICAIPVGELACDDAVLWLWTTNAFMRDAFAVLDAWGFKEKTILTWVKDRMGTGDWLRGKTEHCILAVKGKPTVLLSNQTTALLAPLREHSRKPDEFYELVEKLCPGSKVEMFSRTPREHWAAWGAEKEKFDK